MKTLMLMMSQQMDYVKSIGIERIFFRYGQLLVSLMAIGIIGYFYFTFLNWLGVYFEGALSTNVPPI